jgi:HsdM N-terminal domain
MFEQAFKRIDDVLRKEAGCTTELDYTEQTSWLLFLKYLDGLEEDKATEAALEGKKYTFILDKPYRWESWAAPKDKDDALDHNKALTGDDLRDFVNQKLLALPTHADIVTRYVRARAEVAPRRTLHRCRALGNGRGSCRRRNLEQDGRNAFRSFACRRAPVELQ